MAKKAPAVRRKSDALSIRIDPRLKYVLELAARVQRRAVTGVVEWAITEALADTKVTDKDGRQWPLMDASGLVWSDNELERLMGMWFNFPSLLTYEESRIVEVITRTHELWIDGVPMRYIDLKWKDALEAWPKLKQQLEIAANRPTLAGLTDDDLKQAGLEYLILPF